MRAYQLTAHDRCDRCGKPAAARALSLFNNDTLCLDCMTGEGRLLAALRSSGRILAKLHALESEPCGCECAVEACGPPADGAGRKPICAPDIRAALWRLRAHHALLRIPPGGTLPGQDLPPSL
jgi:hypothetical protein